jgi:hypothetical protein
MDCRSPASSHRSLAHAVRDCCCSRCAHDGVGIDGTAPSLPASVLSWERTRARRTEIAKTLSVSHGSPSRRREPRRSWKACSCNGPTRRHGSPVLPERCCFRIRTRIPSLRSLWALTFRSATPHSRPGPFFVIASMVLKTRSRIHLFNLIMGGI